MYEAQVWCLINRSLFVHRIMDVHQKVRNLFSGNYRLMTQNALIVVADLKSVNLVRLNFFHNLAPSIVNDRATFVTHYFC